jgi:signal peptidase I
VKRIRLRSVLLTGVLLLLVGTAWLYLAPARVGGFTTYVVTHGVSMEPHFHTGDLALVRPADHYRVGDVVAYHSSLLGVVVLHRIVAIRDGHYTFKGDNNNFLDPVHPARAELIGKLWLHMPHAGVVLNGLHAPVVDAALCALLGIFLFYGVGGKGQRRRRRRRRTNGSGPQGPPLVSPTRHHDIARPVNVGALLTASAIAGVVFLMLAVVAFTRPAHRPAALNTRYSQQVNFGYSARIPAGPVYPDGTIKTADPIFLSIVHRLDVHIRYRFTSDADSSLVGTEEVMLNLSGPNGWTRSFVLAPSTRFVGGTTSTNVALNLRQLQSLLAQIEKLTATPAFDDFSLAVTPVVHVHGTLGGHPLTAVFQRPLTFQVASGQLEVSGSTAATGNAAIAGAPASAGATSSQRNYAPSQAGSVATPGTAPNTITVLGVSPQITTLRWISVFGLLISAAAAAFFYLRKRSEPFEETVQIQSQYGHLIVPIVAGEDLGWPPVDVQNIKALVRLAESGQRLILHNRSNGVDTYMVNDEGTVYRYQVKPSKVVWGEWTDAPVPVEQAAA